MYICILILHIKLIHFTFIVHFYSHFYSCHYHFFSECTYWHDSFLNKIQNETRVKFLEGKNVPFRSAYCTIKSYSKSERGSKAHLHCRRSSPFRIATGWWSRIPTRRVLVATIQTRHFVMEYYAQQRRPISLLHGGASFRRRPLLGLMRRARSFLLCARYVRSFVRSFVRDCHATRRWRIFIRRNWKISPDIKELSFDNIAT